MVILWFIGDVIENIEVQFVSALKNHVTDRQEVNRSIFIGQVDWKWEGVVDGVEICMLEELDWQVCWGHPQTTDNTQEHPSLVSKAFVRGDSVGYYDWSTVARSEGLDVWVNVFVPGIKMPTRMSFLPLTMKLISIHCHLESAPIEMLRRRWVPQLDAATENYRPAPGWKSPILWTAD